ncbi:hypothetical protein SDC9_152864 [bioreactor metagenome]|uniref:Uncharacterized protein n=1 Tax=bioreactor metagenome TaxID=1076179 RepID=A0A645EYX8_9ZZZZ
MKVKYTGKSFGVDSLTDGKTYECLGIEYDLLRIIDDSGKDYLYSSINPAPLNKSSPGGKWSIVEDDASGSLAKLIPKS